MQGVEEYKHDRRLAEVSLWNGDGFYKDEVHNSLIKSSFASLKFCCTGVRADHATFDGLWR